jgi:hypothetical protein
MNQRFLGEAHSSNQKNAQMIELFSDSIRDTQCLEKILGKEGVVEKVEEWLRLAREWFNVEFQLDPVTQRMTEQERAHLVDLIMTRLTTLVKCDIEI